MTVSHAPFVHCGTQSVEITVIRDLNGLPLEGALVCLMKEGEVYLHGTTDGTGKATLTGDFLTPGEALITVTARNHRYHEGTMDVAESPVLNEIVPNYGPETSWTPVTVKGAHYTTSPPTVAAVNGEDLYFQEVGGLGDHHRLHPLGRQRWVDVTVYNDYGTDVLDKGYRYFPVTDDPFNAMAEPSEALNPPDTVTLIVSGQAGTPLLGLLRLWPRAEHHTLRGHGARRALLPGLFGDARREGLSRDTLRGSGGLPAPWIFYLHVLGTAPSGDPAWAAGGNEPGGTGSIWLHLWD